MNHRAPRYDLSLSRRNLAALLVLCAVAGGLLAASAAGRRGEGRRIGVDAERVRLAEQRINPNTASVGSLARLRNVGPARAAALVEYRQTRRGAAFRRAEDLLNVRGIGPATVEAARPHLRFDPLSD